MKTVSCTLSGLVIFIILTLIYIYVMKKSNVKSYENITTDL